MTDLAEADWEIWQCRGCEEVTFKETWITSERNLEGKINGLKTLPPNVPAAIVNNLHGFRFLGNTA
jgi:hypothetical protein